MVYGQYTVLRPASTGNACLDQSVLRGTRLVRLYFLAISQEARGRGVGILLVSPMETLGARRGKLFMGLEVAHDNLEAIRLQEVRIGLQYFPILHSNFDRMSVSGGNKLRTAVVIEKQILLSLLSRAIQLFASK